MTHGSISELIVGIESVLYSLHAGYESALTSLLLLLLHASGFPVSPLTKLASDVVSKSMMTLQYKEGRQ